MPLHRFIDPTYNLGGGSFPGTIFGEAYDRINVTSGGAGGGGSANADVAKASGPNVGTYFVAFGEDATSQHFNRANRALAENTDHLDDLLHRDIAMPTFTDVAAGHGGLNARNLNGSTTNIWVSDSSIPVTELFSITDQSNRPIFVAGARVVVSSITGATIGTGWSNANPLTVNFSATIPTAQALRIHYGIRENLAILDPGTTAERSIARSVIKTDNASETLVSTAAFTQLALADIDTKSGGIGTTITQLQEALNNVDSRLTKLRAVSATITDGVNSFGGDHESAVFDDVITNASLFAFYGEKYVKAGTYDIGNFGTATAFTGRLLGVAGVRPIIKFDAARVLNLDFNGDLTFEHIDLRGSGAGTFPVMRFNGALVLRDFVAEAGVINIVLSDQKLVMENGRITSSASTQNFGVLINSTGTTSEAHIRNVFFSAIGTGTGTPTAALEINGLSSEQNGGRLVFENCRFNASSTATADALRIVSSKAYIKFVNCGFFGHASGYGVQITDSKNVVFENCTFGSSVGAGGGEQAARVVNSSVVFDRCNFRAPTGGGTGTVAQLFYGTGFAVAGVPEGALVIKDCAMSWGEENVDATGAPTTAIVEIGTADGAARVDGLKLQPTGLSVPTHNYTTILLGQASTALREPNVYRNIVVDMRGITQGSTGTLGNAIGTSPIDGPVLEAFSTTAPDMQPIIEDLAIINVGNQGTLARGIVAFSRMTVRGFTLDGKSGGATGYAQSLYWSEATDGRDYRIFPTASIQSTNASGWIRLGFGTKIRGLLHNQRAQAVGVSSPVYGFDDYSEIAHGRFFADVVRSSPLVQFLGNACNLNNSYIRDSESTNTTPLLTDGAGGNDHKVVDNHFNWAVSGNTILALVGDRALLMGNHFLSQTVLSLVTFTGTGRVPSGVTIGVDDVNVRATTTINYGDIPMQ